MCARTALKTDPLEFDMHPRRRLVLSSFLLRCGAVVYLLASCSPSSGDPPEVSRGGANNGTGGATNPGLGGGFPTYGGSVTYGGAPSFGGSGVAGGAAKGGAPGSGGSTAVTQGGTTSTGAGGATVTSGGATAVGSGGAGTSACAYDGTTATDSKIFTGGFGASTSGKWSGYAYTYSFGSTATTIKPPAGAMSCFMGAKLCAKGSVAMADADGAGIGWSIGQTMGGSTTAAVAVDTPVNFKIAGAGGGMRVALVNGKTEYCYTLTEADATSARGATGLTVPLASFKTECWGTTGLAFTATTMATAIQIAVPGSATATAAKAFDICILDIEPGT